MLPLIGPASASESELLLRTISDAKAKLLFNIYRYIFDSLGIHDADSELMHKAQP